MRATGQGGGFKMSLILSRIQANSCCPTPRRYSFLRSELQLKAIQLVLTIVGLLQARDQFWIMHERGFSEEKGRVIFADDAFTFECRRSRIPYCWKRSASWMPFVDEADRQEDFPHRVLHSFSTCKTAAVQCCSQQTDQCKTLWRRKYKPPCNCTHQVDYWQHRVMLLKGSSQSKRQWLECHIVWRVCFILRFTALSAFVGKQGWDSHVFIWMASDFCFFWNKMHTDKGRILVISPELRKTAWMSSARPPCRRLNWCAVFACKLCSHWRRFIVLLGKVVAWVLKVDL